MSSRSLCLSDGWVRALDELPADQRMVALHVAIWCFRNDLATARGQREIAEAVGVSRRQVQNTLAELAARGLLTPRAPGGLITAPTLAARGLSCITIEAVAGAFEMTPVGDPQKPSVKSAGKPQERSTNDPRSEPLASDAATRAIDPRIDPRAQRVADPSHAGDLHSLSTGENASDVAPLHDRGADSLTCKPGDGTSGSRSTPNTAADPVLDLGADSDRSAHSETESSGPKKAPAAKRKSARALKLEELPPAAVAQADAFRAHVLIAQPWHQARKATPWEAHALRLRWAQDFDRLAKERSDGPLDEPRVYAQISTMLTWLAGDQGTAEARYRIIVLSTDALREKWERIAARVAPRRIASTATSSPAAHAATTRRLVSMPAPLFDPLRR